jgi:hypothetical protein
MHANRLRVLQSELGSFGKKIDQKSSATALSCREPVRGGVWLPNTKARQEAQPTRHTPASSCTARPSRLVMLTAGRISRQQAHERLPFSATIASSFTGVARLRPDFRRPAAFFGESSPWHLPFGGHDRKSSELNPQAASV